MAAPDNHAAPQHGGAARDVPATAGEVEEAAENRPEAGDAFSVVVDVLRMLWIQALGTTLWKVNNRTPEVGRGTSSSITRQF